MKFSVEVETESHLFENVPGVMKPSPLQWDIQVEVVQKAVETSKGVVKDHHVISSSKKSVMMSSIPESSATPQPNSSAMKKMSSTSELLARMGKGKKVGGSNHILNLKQKHTYSNKIIYIKIKSHKLKSTQK